MSGTTKREVVAEAWEKVAPIWNEVESKKKKFVENAAVLISFAVIVFSIILYAFNKGYCKVFNLPPDVLSLDMTRLVPLATQVLSIATYGLFYVSSFKADRTMKKNRIDYLRILWGSHVVLYLFMMNNVSAVIGRWWSIILAFSFPILVEYLLYLRKKPKKNNVISEEVHEIVLEDTIREAIFSIYYIKYGIFLIVLPVAFAPFLGEFSAKAEREYQTCVVRDATYAVVVDYSDRVLAQQANEENGILNIDTSSYTYFDKKELVLQYSKYENVVIGVENEIKQPVHFNVLWMKIKEVLNMPTVTDWLMVFITLVYVVATIRICKANIKSAEATRDQLAESKRQYDEENRAYVTYAFIFEKKAFYGLRFTNHGKRVAKKVRIAFRDVFIQSLTNTQFSNQLNRISNNECVLGINQSIDVYFGGQEFRDNVNKLPIEGDIIYSDDVGEYSEHFVIDFNSYPPIFTVDSEIEDIRQEMKKQTTEMERLRREITLLRQNMGQENYNA